MLFKCKDFLSVVSYNSVLIFEDAASNCRHLEAYSPFDALL